MKTCSRSSCKQINPQQLTEFHVKKATYDGLASHCKSCDKIYRSTEEFKQSRRLREGRNSYKELKRSWYKKYCKTKEFRQSRREKELLRCYNLTIDQYNYMLCNQNYSCAICKKHESIFKKGLAVDHCHKTGKVRGLLCGGCNVSLGRMEDSIELLTNAIEYLKKC